MVRVLERVLGRGAWDGVDVRLEMFRLELVLSARRLRFGPLEIDAPAGSIWRPCGPIWMPSQVARRRGGPPGCDAIWRPESVFRRRRGSLRRGIRGRRTTEDGARA